MMKKKAFFLCMLSFYFAVTAQQAQSEKNILDKSSLTGDWSGARSWLSDKGVYIQPRISSFSQVGFQGNKDESAIGGKADVQVALNGEKLGLWKGFNIISHAEYNFGRSVNGKVGTFLPVNTALYFPGLKDESRFDVTSLYILQKIGNNKVLMAGKINMVDVAAGSKFIGGMGIDTFEHIAFVAPPSGLVPPYIFGALFSLKTQPFNYTLGIYDPVSAVNKTGFEAPFNKGVTFYGSVEKPVKIAGKSGSHALKAVFSSQNGVSLSNISDIIIHPELSEDIPVRNSRYYFGYSFFQYVVQSPQQPAKGWGIFGNIGFSDANPTPLDWSCIVGIGGNSLFKNRLADNWGAGFFHQSISNSLRKSASVLGRTLEDETGIEAFYNYQVAGWFSMGLNFKFINPSVNFNQLNQDSYFFGLRSSVKL